jgi:hypothetical protein
VPDDEDSLIVPAQRQVAEETADTGDGLPPAFPARIRLVQVLTSTTVHLDRRHPVALSVITLAQPPVVQRRNVGPVSRPFRCEDARSDAKRRHRLAFPPGSEVSLVDS